MLGIDSGKAALSRDAVATWLASASARFAARWALVLAMAVMTAGYMLFGGLSPRIGLLGLALAVLLAFILPNGRVSGGPAGSAPPPGDAWSATTWRSLLDAIPDPALALDVSGLVLHLNPAAREAYPDARLSAPVGLVSRDPALLAALDRTTAEQVTTTVELHERVPIERRMRVTLAALGGAASAESGLPATLLVMRDLTEQDRLARMRADFVANASHELRTPLASLAGFIETLQERAANDPEARARFLAIMSEQATRMRRLVDDLLSLSRVEMREHVPPMEAVEIADAVAAAIQALEPMAHKSEVAVTLVDMAKGARVRADRDEMVQVTQNLVQNAIKYGRRKGKVEVEIRREKSRRSHRIAVSVRDDGPGIAPQHLPRLTERFYRVSAEASREKGGTGLGLAIVKHIVNRHRGELRISSNAGEGSTFTFAIPEIEHGGRDKID